MLECLEAIKKSTKEAIEDIKNNHNAVDENDNPIDEEWAAIHITGDKFFTFDEEKNTITVKLQKGSIKEKGRNGASLSDFFSLAQRILECTIIDIMVSQLSKKDKAAKTNSEIDFQFIRNNTLQSAFL